MKRKTFHVIHENSSEKWKIEQAGTNFPLASFGTKAPAVEFAVQIAKNGGGLTQVKIHGLDGKIQNEWTYGKDPFPPRG